MIQELSIVFAVKHKSLQINIKVITRLIDSVYLSLRNAVLLVRAVISKLTRRQEGVIKVGWEREDLKGLV
jgi:hypothetical protein